MEKRFERLRPTDYEGKSDPDWDYNCIAWAMGRDDKHFWPSEIGGSTWPKGLPREEPGAETLANFIRAFRRIQYKVSNKKDYSLERGIEKVAIYVKSQQNPTHAARQLPSGIWTSKIGEEEDIEHISPAVLEGAFYGTVAVVMFRRSHAFL